MKYNFSTKRFSQKISTLCISSFEGSFDDIINKMTEEKKWYTERYSRPTLVSPDDYRRYADGTRQKLVAFDKFDLRVEEEYGDRVIAIHAERDMLPEEIKAMEEQQKEAEEKRQLNDLALFEQLKKKLGKE